MTTESTPPSDKTVLILSCSGAANVGAIADEGCRRLTFDGRGEEEQIATLQRRLETCL